MPSFWEWLFKEAGQWRMESPPGAGVRQGVLSDRLHLLLICIREFVADAIRHNPARHLKKPWAIKTFFLWRSLSGPEHTLSVDIINKLLCRLHGNMVNG